MATTTVQEAYEKILAYFSRPNAVLAKRVATEAEEDAFLGSPVCEYRSPDGNKCAVGCLISDELYDALKSESEFDLEMFGNVHGIEGQLSPRLERGENGNLRALATILGLAEDGSGFGEGRMFYFLANAQYAHDTKSEDAADFVQQLDEIAQDNGLTVVTQ